VGFDARFSRKPWKASFIEFALLRAVGLSDSGKDAGESRVGRVRRYGYNPFQSGDHFAVGERAHAPEGAGWVQLRVK
jgi:hypothetical protein